MQKAQKQIRVFALERAGFKLASCRPLVDCLGQPSICIQGRPVCVKHMGGCKNRKLNENRGKFINFAEIGRGKFINFAEIGRWKFTIFLEIGDNSICIIGLRGMDAPVCMLLPHTDRASLI